VHFIGLFDTTGLQVRLAELSVSALAIKQHSLDGSLLPARIG
jgi:hypothetical protein